VISTPFSTIVPADRPKWQAIVPRDAVMPLVQAFSQPHSTRLNHRSAGRVARFRRSVAALVGGSKDRKTLPRRKPSHAVPKRV
jgi:hypothetical protein